MLLHRWVSARALACCPMPLEPSCLASELLRPYASGVPALCRGLLKRIRYLTLGHQDRMRAALDPRFRIA